MLLLCFFVCRCLFFSVASLLLSFAFTLYFVCLLLLCCFSVAFLLLPDVFVTFHLELHITELVAVQKKIFSLHTQCVFFDHIFCNALLCFILSSINFSRHLSSRVQTAHKKNKPASLWWSSTFADDDASDLQPTKYNKPVSLWWSSTYADDDASDLQPIKIKPTSLWCRQVHTPMTNTSDFQPIKRK